MMRLLLALTGVVAALSGSSAPPVSRLAGGAGVVAGPVRYAAPVPGPLVVRRRFDPPRTRYGTGHLGVDLGLPAGGAVSAAAAGSVTFAGSVAGRGVVVLRHADGVSTEYEPVRVAVTAGAAVRLGDVIGHLDGEHRGCGTDCLHWGAQRAGVRLDPLALLRPLGPVRLLPWPASG